MTDGAENVMDGDTIQMDTHVGDVTASKEKRELQSTTNGLPALSLPETNWRLAERQAAVMGKASEAVPKAFRNKPADIMAAWLMADELGISRMAMLRGAYVVNGKPQLSGDLIMAVARGAGVKVTETLETVASDIEGEEVPVAICKAELPNGEVVSATFSAIDAQMAGLWGGSDAWKKYPQRMLKMRARGFCLRDAIPHLLAGVYTEGEIIEG